MITEVILYENPYADFDKTAESILESDAAKSGRVKLLIADLCGSAAEDERVAKLLAAHSDMVQMLAGRETEPSFAQVFKAAVEAVRTEYVHFLYCGDALTPDAVSAALTCLNNGESGRKCESGEKGSGKNNNHETVRPQVAALKSEETKEQVFMDREGMLTLKRRPFAVPMDIGMLFFRKQLLEDIAPDEQLRFLGEYDLLAKVYQRQEELPLVPSGSISFREDHIANLDNFSNSSKKEWYEELVGRFAPSFAELFGETLPLYAQYMLFYMIRLMFLHNLNHRDKHVYHKGYEEFLTKCQKAFAVLDDEVIANVNEYERFLLDHMTVIYFFKIKYGTDDCFSYVTEASRGHVYLTVSNIMLGNITAQDVRLEVLDENEKEFIIECSTRIFAKEEDFTLHCRMAGKELPVEKTYRYSHYKYFGHSYDRRRTYRVRIPKQMTKKRAALAFYSEFHGHWHVLKIESLRYTARLNSEMESAYCVLGNCFIDLRPDKKRIFFSPYWRRAHISRERRYLRELKQISKELYDLRVAYWKNYRKYSKKKIWMTFDKLYKGGDCGEYFYKYVRTHDDGIDAEYLITEGVPDDKRLTAEGYRPLHFGSREHKIKFLFADVIAATHPNVGLYSGLSQEDFAYFEDLLRAKVVCIQHGLAVQQLAFNVNQVYDNTKTFYVASKYEKQNLSHPIYAYPEDAIRLTGIPRFDGLKSDNQKQILIAPTWRSYIAMPPSMGSARPYSPTFHETDYFRIYQSLIDDQRIREAAKKYTRLRHPRWRITKETMRSRYSRRSGYPTKSFSRSPI